MVTIGHRSCCTCVETALTLLFADAFSSVLVAELTEASIFLKICPRVGG